MINKIKICFISMYAYPLFNKKCNAAFGGAEVQLYQTAKEIAKDADYEVSFITGDFGQKKVEFIDGVKIVKSFSQKKDKLKYIKAFYYLFDFISTLEKMNSGVYIQKSAGIETGLTALFCKLFKKKFIYMTASSIDVDMSFKKINPMTGIFYAFGLHNANFIITQNRQHQLLLERNYRRKSVVIKNPFTIPDEVLSKKKSGFVIWVGSAQELKQPQLFLKIARKIPDEKFVMIMPKHNKILWDEIKKQSEKLTNLTFIERVPFEEIGEFFSHAKLFVNTSTYEGFPNTFVQAAMYGTPIASLNVNPDNFLEEYNCGFCSNGNFDDMIDKMKKLLNDKSKWNEMSENAYTYAKENHDIKKIIGSLKNVIGKMAC